MADVKKKKQPGKTVSAMFSTKGSTGVISWFKRKVRLTFLEKFLENKPVVYKAQVVRGPVVKGNDLVAYAANAAHVPESTIRMAKEALFQAIVYYCTQGHPVEIPNLGTISVGLRTKTVKNEDDLNADVIRQKYLRWFPKKELRLAGALANVNLVENKELSKLAIAAGPDWKGDEEPEP